MQKGTDLKSASESGESEHIRSDGGRYQRGSPLPEWIQGSCGDGPFATFCVVDASPLRYIFLVRPP
eukprot:859011-Rhodomonas_salina.3